jgi:gliding motility-associated-like protein
LTPSSVTITAAGNSIKYQWIDSNNVTCLNPQCSSVSVSPHTTTTYTVIGTDSNGCTAEQLITITVDVPCFNLVIPNVFTPTTPGPLGLNKEFYIDTRNIDGWSIVIFDRWGKQMYNSTNQYQYWTGTTEGGGDAPSGVYYYIIHGTCQGTSYTKDGFVQLIR